MVEISDPPERSYPSELAEIAAEAGLAYVPIFGPVLSVFFGRWIAAPYQRRQEDFLRDIVSSLHRLTEEMDELRREDVLSNPELLSAVSMATRAAEHTHQREKLDALRNAVLNVAIGFDADFDITATLMRHVDQLTPLHVRVLKVLEDPASAAEALDLPVESKPQTIAEVINGVFHDTFADGEYGTFTLLEGDLANAGFVVRGLVGSRLTPGKSGPITPFGRRFLQLIQEPTLESGQSQATDQR